MLRSRLLSFFGPPRFADEERSRTAEILSTLLNHLTILLVLSSIFGLFFAYANRLGSMLVLLVLWAVILLGRVLLLRGLVRLASTLVVACFWLIFGTLALLTGGLYSINNVFFLAVTVVAGLLLGSKAAWAVALLSSATLLAVAVAHLLGLDPPQPFPAPPLSRWVQFTVGLVFSITPLNLALKNLAEALRRAREELRERELISEAVEREKRFSDTLIDGMPGVFLMFDEERRLVRWNDLLRVVTGCSPERLATLQLRDLFEPEREQLIETQLDENGSQGHFELECELLGAEERRIPVFLGGWRRLLGSRSYLIVVGIDISERKRAEAERQQLEEQLIQAQKMESIGRLAGGIAHDFNNLLTAIIGNTSLALLDVPEEGRLTEHLLEIDRAAESATRLTRQLLSFSRRQIVEPRVLDLNDHLEEMRRMLERLLGENVELVTLPAEELGKILIDPGQLEQVIINLSINARDAMPQGGRLTLATSNLHVEEERAELSAGDYVRLSVRDEGEGIDPAHVERVFEPFFTTKAEGKGTGLGLATVYGIVAQAGGQVSVTSTVGAGSSFEVFLPRVEPPLTTPVPAGPLSAELPRGAHRVLIAEDEASVRAMATSALEMLGYEVIACANGQEALDAARRCGGQLQLLLTDVVMPGLNGRQLADSLCAEHPHVKVLFTSGYTDDVIADHGVLEPGLCYLAKPYTVRALALKVTEVLSQGEPYRLSSPAKETER